MGRSRPKPPGVGISYAPPIRVILYLASGRRSRGGLSDVVLSGVRSLERYGLVPSYGKRFPVPLRARLVGEGSPAYMGVAPATDDVVMALLRLVGLVGEGLSLSVCCHLR